VSRRINTDMSNKRLTGAEDPDPYALMARFYDADYEADGRGEDIAFYSALARKLGGPVLEMGCGSGRNLLPIARSGIAIHGIDSSPAMLGALRAKLSAEPSQVSRRVGLMERDIGSQAGGV